MLNLCGLFVILETVDATLTLWAVHHGFTEVNPLMAPLAGTWLGPLVKIVPALAASWLLLYVARRWPRTMKIMRTGLVVVCCLVALVIASNLMEL